MPGDLYVAVGDDAEVIDVRGLDEQRRADGRVTSAQFPRVDAGTGAATNTDQPSAGGTCTSTVAPPQPWR